uniref:Cytochrome c oxidase subunit NDUFA4 n=1 Tax=Sciurus vulgaris TaxID=55149 RepID=A0A8D2DJ92_SCIVU
MLFQIMCQVKQHPSLIPLFVFIGAGDSRAVLYMISLALFNIDVCWHRKNNPGPWNKLSHDQYEFYSMNMEYSTLKKEGPDL